MPAARTPRESRRQAGARAAPLRLVTAVPLCDGHDSAIVTINLELARHGAEVVYLGYHQAASAIARAAIQEDAHGIGLSSYNGGHVVFFREVLAQLRKRGARDIAVFGGGGGTLSPADARALLRSGVRRIFFAGTPLDEIVRRVTRDCARRLKRDPTLRGDRALARAITLAESAFRPRPARSQRSAPRRGFVVGVAGPGGAGKSTLIDELTARFLQARPQGRLAVLANDPSHPATHGAILGDRVSALHAQDDRVFFRSLATRGSLTGLSAAAPAAIEILRRSGEFDLILVESVGIGQESDPFGVFTPEARLADAVLYVVAPHYGGRIQLQKIALLDGADLVVLNKCDDPRAASARVELAARLRAIDRPPALHTTVAAQHRDPGTDALFAALRTLAGLEPAGGEKPCQLRIDP
jgi:methylmalonyl-CoA mutase